MDGVIVDGMGRENDRDAIECGGISPPARGLAVRFVASEGIVLEGDRVKAWRNQVAAGPEATQASADLRPTIQANAINGKPVVHLDGQNDFLSFRYPVDGKTKLTLAAVSRTWAYQMASPNSDCGTGIGRELNCSGTDQSLLCWNEPGGGFISSGVFYAVGQDEVTFRFGTGQGYKYFKTPFVLEKALKASFNWNLGIANGTERVFYLDGKVPRGRVNYSSTDFVELRTTTDSATQIRAEPDAWIGKGRFQPATSHWAGDVAEILVYDAALDAEERAALEKYFNCAYFPDRQ